MAAKKKKKNGGGGVPANLLGQSGILDQVLEDLCTQFRTLRALHISALMLAGAGFLASLGLWIYVLVTAGEVRMKMLLVEGIVLLILLAAHLYRIFFIGYDDSLWNNFRMIVIADAILTLAGFFIAKINLLGVTQAAQTTQYGIMNGAAVAAAALIGSLLPAFLLALLLWLFMQTINFFHG